MTSVEIRKKFLACRQYNLIIIIIIIIIIITSTFIVRWVLICYIYSYITNF